LTSALAQTCFSLALNGITYQIEPDSYHFLENRKINLGNVFSLDKKSKQVDYQFYMWLLFSPSYILV